MRPWTRTRGWKMIRSPVIFLTLLLLVSLSLAAHQDVAGCPERCVCYSDLTKGIKLKVDCQSQGLTKVPDWSAIAKNISHIDLYNNSIKVLRSADFQILTSLQLVDLQMNKIETVEDKLFINAETARPLTVYLGSNRITFVPDRVFDGIAILDELDLSHNRLRAPPNLSHVVQIYTLKLNNNPFYGLQADAFDGIGPVFQLDLSFCNLTVDNVSPLALQPQGLNFNLEYLYLDGNNILGLDRTFFEHFPSRLLTLSMRNCNIRSLEGRTFLHIRESLRTLLMSGNNLTRLSPNGFNQLVLEELDLRACNIMDIAKGALKLRVRTLHLAFNNIPVIHAEDFKELKGVSELDLSYCGIETIKEDPFSELLDLKDLILTGNRLTNEGFIFNSPRNLLRLYLEGNQFTHVPVNGSQFPDLTELFLSHNPIETLRREDLNGFPSLLDLTLRNTSLHFTEDDAFADCCPKLRLLNLDYSNISHLPDLSNLKSLRYLAVSFCNLQVLPSNLCENNKELLIITAERNDLETLPSFSGCQKLVSLTFSYNRLSQISSDTFTGVYFLEVLKLVNNRLSEIPHSAFEDLWKLEILDLSLNSLKTLPDLSNSQVLREVAVRYNNVSVIPDDYFHNKTYLKLLYMHHNSIEMLPDLSHNYLLKDIDFSHNRLMVLKRNSFEKNAYLEILNLNDNQIMYIDNLAFPSGMILHKLDLSTNNFKIWNLPWGGFPYLYELQLTGLPDLAPVPTPDEIPQIQILNFTYPYQCQPWIDAGLVQPNLTRPGSPLSFSTPEPDTAVPTYVPVTLPDTHSPAIDFINPFMGRPCPESGQLSEEELLLLDLFAEQWNVTIIVHPDCRIEVVGNNDIFGTNEDTLFENVPPAPTDAPPVPRERPEWEKIQCYPTNGGVKSGGGEAQNYHLLLIATTVLYFIHYIMMM